VLVCISSPFFLISDQSSVKFMVNRREFGSFIGLTQLRTLEEVFSSVNNVLPVDVLGKATLSVKALEHSVHLGPGIPDHGRLATISQPTQAFACTMVL